MKISRELYKTIWQMRNILIKINEPITNANPYKGEYYIYGFYNPTEKALEEMRKEDEDAVGQRGVKKC